MRGYLALHESTAAPRPGVLVFHEGLGLGDFAMERARRLAGLGYVALAADMFGDRRQAPNLKEVATLVGGLRAEPEQLRARGRAALAALATLPQVDAGRLAAIGFCFGGSVVLELAREGADLKAVVSFHGVLATRMPAVTGTGEVQRAGLHRGRGSPGAAGTSRRFQERDAYRRGLGLAGHRLRQHPARFHQSCRRWLDDAHSALQRTGRPPLLGVDAKPVRRSLDLTKASVWYLMDRMLTKWQRSQRHARTDLRFSGARGSRGRMFGILGLGFLLGMQHALEADHIAAVSSIAARRSHVADIVKHGLTWGLGHTLTLFVFAGAAILLGHAIPETIARPIETAVGVMLIGLGAMCCGGCGATACISTATAMATARCISMPTAMPAKPCRMPVPPMPTNMASAGVPCWSG